jgi:hypothetical protein
MKKINWIVLTIFKHLIHVLTPDTYMVMPIFFDNTVKLGYDELGC